MFECHLIRVSPKLEEVSPIFLNWLLRSPRLRAIAKSKAKTATMTTIDQQSLASIPIVLPPLAEQKRIAGILDAADALRAKRREALTQLDTLLQATFLDLFGDPVTNPEGWKEGEALGDLCDVASGITKGRKLNGESTREVPYLAVINVQDRHLWLDTVKTIEATTTEIERYRLLPGDLVLTEGGDRDKLGRGSLWNGKLKDCIHQNHIFRVRVKDKRLDPVFVEWLVGSRRGKNYFLRSAKQTTGIASINMTQLRAFPMFIPPLDLQRRFTEIAATMGRQEALMKTHLAELDTLFASLQARAFRGEL